MKPDDELGTIYGLSGKELRSTLSHPLKLKAFLYRLQIEITGPNRHEEIGELHRQIRKATDYCGTGGSMFSWCVYGAHIDAFEFFREKYEASQNKAAGIEKLPGQ
ncbi:hypothetical protein [Mesorhizobium sp. M0522]|uniref:hypothetical protein n=1 Tax=Mesorhizobium sp. M0522 TaxID=2956958 RepID=UPI003338C80A